MQPGYPGQDPYGQQPHQDPTAPQPHDPYAPPPAAPYGQHPTSGQPYGQPHDPYAAPQNPYGQPPTSGQPYGQPPTSGQPYGQPSYDPYGQQAAPGQPYGQQPYQDPYGQQAHNAPPMYPNAGYPPPQGQQNTLGLVSMILGIVSIPMVCCYLGIPLGIAAVVTGWLGKQKADQGLANNSGQALAGLICGAIGALLGVLQIVLLLAGLNLPSTT
ncbi:DUF4190 domain-containing protein [Micromonospora phytophila]|uniref:DUF4190 domain-containing protein n=1 Tax=Micromonospora phytophila TaxID=709888 RepID=UPI0020303E6A|nr:DUF4190 domain-containing protein [Micromonospora phytophila]MCM0674745.1 DUF4190 domain-containing protein [Micromonospora phytophila]